MSLDQDNVFNGAQEPDPLSPSEFSNNKNKTSFEEEENEYENTPKSKKPTKWIPYLAIGFAVLMTLFAMWKIFVAPNKSNEESSTTLQAAPATGSGLSANQPSVPAPQVAAQPSSQPVASAPAVQTTPQQPASAPAEVNQAQAQQPASPSAAPTTQAAPTAQAQAVIAGQTANSADVTKLDSRLDALEKSVAEIKASLQKQGNPGRSTGSQIRKNTVKSVARHEKKTAKVKPTAKSGKSNAAQSTESAPRKDLHLKAVLEGRAWFQDKSGASITAAPGDSVPGFGVIKSVDADNGVVTFSNGLQVR